MIFRKLICQGQHPVGVPPAEYVCRDRSCDAPVPRAQALIECCTARRRLPRRPIVFHPYRGSRGLERVGLLDGDACAEEVVVAYHDRTEHHVHRYVASLGYMDWATQPDPFRRYAGADIVRLPLPETGRPLPYWQLYASAIVPPMPLSVASFSLFFRYALSLTAWMSAIAVGMPVARHPPHRSQRAQLTHWAPTLGI
ncbi:MAG: hypothetical protein ABI305_03205 [Tepidiformaceae bacterium]